MKFLLLPVVFCPFLVLSIETHLIKSYLKHRNVQVLNIYGCFNQKEQFAIVKEISDGSLVRIFNLRRNFSVDGISLKNNKPMGVVLDVNNCAEIDASIKQFSDLQTFTLTNHWLIITKSDFNIEETFKNAKLTISSDLKIAKIHENSSSYDVFDVYNPAHEHNGNLKISKYIEWNTKSQKFESQGRQNQYWLRRNMTGVTFKSLVVLPKPFPGKLVDYLLYNDADREINSFNRFHSVVTYHVRDFYNYTIDMNVTKSWGYKAPNGTFDGLVRALELRQVDFGASPLFVKHERLPALDYGRRTWILKSAFLFRRPKRPASFEVFLRPLDGQVWNLTVIAFLIIVILLKLTLKTETEVANEANFDGSWSNITLFTLGALCQQGADISPRSMSSRIAFIFIFIFAVLLYQYYNASIVAFLVMTPAKFINTLADLAHSSLYLLCENVLYNKDYINKLKNDPVVSLMVKKSPHRSEDSFYVEPEVALPKVAQGGFAFHVELATAYPIIAKSFDEDAVCSLDEIELFRIQQMHQPLQKGSPFKEMLDHVLHKIDESGLMHRQQSHWHARKPECIRSRPATSSVSIEDFYPALTFFFFGITLSAVVLILEHGFKYYQRKRKEFEKRKKAFRKKSQVMSKKF